MSNRLEVSLSRRRFLTIGALGGGLSLADALRLHAAGEVDPARTGRSGILLFLDGGPSHQDTFDLKPNAPANVRGEFRPIATSVPGVEICEHLPLLARRAEEYAIVRSLTHNLADHGLGSRYLRTGNRPNPLLRYPSYGSVASRELPAAFDLPAYVAVDRDDEGPGFLGLQYGALATGEKPRANQPFHVRGVTLDEGDTLEALRSRGRLLEDLDTGFRGQSMLDDEVRALDQFSRQAREIIASPRTRAAFDLERESPAVARRFGTHEFGLQALLACRLITAGTRFVTVNLGGWDTHRDNFGALKQALLPAFDQALAALLDTLAERDLLASTAVLAVGEFGRTPKVNGQGGRDHWARAMTALLAGGDVAAGSVIGATNAEAAEPAGDAHSPDDLAATFYRNLGIDPTTEYHSGSGRPITLVRDGSPIPTLLRG